MCVVCVVCDGDARAGAFGVAARARRRLMVDGMRLCALCQDCFVVLCAAVVLCAKRTARTLLFKLNHFEIRFQSDWLEICNVLIGLTILCGTHTCLRHVLTIPVPPGGMGQVNVEGTGLGLY